MVGEGAIRLDGPVPGIPDAEIREVDNLPQHLTGATPIGPYTEALPGALLFEVPGVARYLVRDGRSIEVLVAGGADRDAVALFLNDYARGTLIHQRGELPLAATTILAPNFRCVALCGPSSFGKSSLAAELCRRGWLLLADGVTRITWNGSVAVAWPGDTALKLWRDACEQMGIDVSACRPVRPGLEKYSVPMASAESPAALSHAVRLRGGELELVHFPPNDSGGLISECTYRQRQITPLGRRAEHVRMIENMAGTVAGLGLSGARQHPVASLADILVGAIQ